MNDAIEYMFAVHHKHELHAYHDFENENKNAISSYMNYVRENYDVLELPKYLIFANREFATKIINDLPLPAYTNDVRIVITPELRVWRQIYIQQLDIYPNNQEIQEIRNYYENSVSNNHILQLIGHEMMHHSELFIDDFWEENCNVSGIWFEEGMVEYISRKYFLTEEEYSHEMRINLKLINLYEQKYGRQHIDTYPKQIHEKNMTEIFYYYWRSLLIIDRLVKEYGSVQAVFKTYKTWGISDRKLTLANWLGVE